MDGDPRLLLCGYSEEKLRLINSFLKEMGAPPAVPILRNQGSLPLRTIIYERATSGEDCFSEERVILFYNIPQKGVHFLIHAFKQTDLPPPIYAVVTEHSIDWPFCTLLEHLIEEREAWSRRSIDEKGSE